jgi:hypothetical protein
MKVNMNNQRDLFVIGQCLCCWTKFIVMDPLKATVNLLPYLTMER